MKKLLILTLLLLSACEEKVVEEKEVIEMTELTPAKEVIPATKIEEIIKYEVDYNLYLNDKLSNSLMYDLGEIENRNLLDLSIFDNEDYLLDIYITTSDSSYVPYVKTIYKDLEEHRGLKVTYVDEVYYAYFDEEIIYAKVDERGRITSQIEINPSLNEYLWLDNYNIESNKIQGIYQEEDILNLLNMDTYISDNYLYLASDVVIDVYYTKHQVEEHSESTKDNYVRDITEQKLKEKQAVDNYLYFDGEKLLSGNITTKMDLVTANYECVASIYHINDKTKLHYLFNKYADVDISVKVKKNNITVKSVVDDLLKDALKLEENESFTNDYIVYYEVEIDDEDYSYSGSYRESITVYN